jgi:hypothetical protein
MLWLLCDAIAAAELSGKYPTVLFFPEMTERLTISPLFRKL